MKVKRDQITGALLIALGIAIATLTSQFRTEMTAAYPGPKLFPLIAAFGFIVCGAGIFIGSLFSKKGEEVFLTKAGWIKVAAIVACLCLYILLLKYVGYMICTPFILFAFCTIIAKGDGDRKVGSIGRIVFSVIFTAFIYVIYIHVFGMTLPAGILFD